MLTASKELVSKSETRQIETSGGGEADALRQRLIGTAAAATV